jgi:hypothetical protein
MAQFLDSLYSLVSALPRSLRFCQLEMSIVKSGVCVRACVRACVRQ